MGDASPLFTELVDERVAREQVVALECRGEGPRSLSPSRAGKGRIDRPPKGWDLSGGRRRRQRPRPETLQADTILERVW
jgi:hypothetical protein